MKPFNLEEARAGKKVVLRNGWNVLIGGYNKNANKGSEILGWADSGHSMGWHEDGHHVNYSEFDVVGMAPEKKTVRVVVLKSEELDLITTYLPEDGDMVNIGGWYAGFSPKFPGKWYLLAESVIEYED